MRSQLQVVNTYYLLNQPKGDSGRRLYHDPMIMPSWILLNEYHHSKSIVAPPFNHIFELQKECHDGIPYPGFLSGTPLETGPANFLGLFSCLLGPSPGIPSPTNYASVEVDDLYTKDKRFQAIQASVKKYGTETTDLKDLQEIGEWTREFLLYWCIRRTVLGQWFD